VTSLATISYRFIERLFSKWSILQYGTRMREEVTVEWRKLHNEEIYGTYASPNVIRVIKSRITRRQGM
jgi:hypothetical protein